MQTYLPFHNYVYLVNYVVMYKDCKFPLYFGMFELNNIQHLNIVLCFLHNPQNLYIFGIITNIVAS